MPQEIDRRSDVLAAVKNIQAIADIVSQHDGHYEYEIDLEVMVYGRNYNGKKVGPYVRLLNYSNGEEIIREGDWGGNTFFIVAKGDAEVFVNAVGTSKVGDIKPGEQFGEMSILAGVPRTATVKAPMNGSVQVLEVQRPALRLLRKLPKYGPTLDGTYRKHGRSETLQELVAAAHLTPEVVKQLEAISVFRVHGKGHVLFRQGVPIDRVYYLKTGWVRISPGDKTTALKPGEGGGGHNGKAWNTASPDTYVGPAHVLGLEGVVANVTWPRSGVVLGRSELLEISVAKLREDHELYQAVVTALNPTAVAIGDASKALPMPVAEAQKELIDSGMVDGTNLMVMDMDLCVRCGNCSLACHTIQGQSRLYRRGIHITRPTKPKKSARVQSVMNPSVCMHCKDPECLTGCPTGAIGRLPGGQVDINPPTCIGCGDCATQCPYDAISLVPRRPKDPPKPAPLWKRLLRVVTEPPPPSVDTTEDLVAIKCNLCTGTGMNPKGAKRPAYSCEQNCPTGALLRVDPRNYFSEIRSIKGVYFKDSTHAVARHLGHTDKGKQLMHLLGMVLTIGLTVLTIMGMMRYALDTPVVGTWLSIRWITGIVGLIGIVGVMLYPVRRQIYKRRAGPLRYWMLSHTYLGAIAGSLLLLHGGTRSGGILTTALMISFDLVILTGLFGIFVYFAAPRMLTSIEGMPLMIDDLIDRREELSDEIGALIAASPQTTGDYIRRKVLPSYVSFGFLLSQYLKRDSIEKVRETARAKFTADVQNLPPPERDAVLGSAEKAATMRRVDALIYMHQLLKVWLAPHVLTTSLMLALMIVHIIQVVYFAAK